MSLRISSTLAALAVLAGCGGAQSPEPAGETIACAIGKGADFAEVCTMERIAGSAQIIVHHPDGGFRRLTYDPATGTLATLDGADPVVLEEGQGVLQFAIGADRYRIPREPAAAPTP
ncbi:hypothetical protein [Erythrobacter donghaensis]|jgi:hypothetical protein|uniref:hypothetical protein n=1 Tax=Erythrobacter donghaensis TaxID=267135 RepID=UPI000B236D83|nr:hypothetical protein [Erythrobacter donghaensis]